MYVAVIGSAVLVFCTMIYLGIPWYLPAGGATLVAFHMKFG